MAEKKVEAFILFNEHEDGVEETVKALESSGVSTHFWRRDIPYGDEWHELESERLKEADAVLVFLGSLGWGPTHLRLTEEALGLKKRVIPVLIDDPPTDAFDAAGGLFRSRRYLELRDPDAESIAKLVAAVRRREPSRAARIERIVRILVDGNEEERAEIFSQIGAAASIDRPALAARLREEITRRFGPLNEREFTSAARDPKKISSIRSWMLSSLIRVDAESEESRTLLLRHVDPSSEPDRNVRFWTLAGLIQINALFVGEALQIGRDDEADEIAALARAAASPPGPEVIEDFRKKLSTGDFQIAWPVLRVLRVVPLPELAGDVCEQLNQTTPGSPLAYDALYALANPVMARASAAALSHHPGLDGVVERVIAEAQGSNTNAARNFAGLLTVFDEAGVDRALEAALGVPENRDLAQRLRRHLAEYRGRDGAGEGYVAGFAPDTINVSDDRLDIREDVRTLTAVMLAKEVTPPLAIGLFGDWGSGKSFFMQSMKAAVSELSGRAARSPSSAFCADVVSIEFNAWHYVDTNLWASLVSYILERLAAHVSPQKTEEETQTALMSELGSAKAVVGEAESEKKRAEELLTRHQQELQRLKLERERKEVRLLDLRAHDLMELLSDEDKKALETSLDEIGLPAALNSVSDLSRVVSEAYTVRGRANALFVALLNGRNRLLVWFLLAFVLVIVPLGAYYLRQYVNDFVVAASALVSEFVAVVVGVTGVLRGALTRTKASLKIVEDTRQRVEKALAKKREQPSPDEVALQQDIAGLSAKEQEAASRLATAAARVQELEDRIRSIKEGKSLARFLAERTTSEDYRKHLGLISTVRRDFESLGARLSRSQTESGEDGLRRVDRIILYIDDLDRCPADKVMDVLQAVHLLLAYPLFVVVVGVDPRWLLHSLGTTYSAFQGGGQHFSANPDLWRTTPQNYLEKIFQIPFSLRPMTPVGYGRLIEKLFSTAAAPEQQGGASPGSADAPREGSAPQNTEARPTPTAPPPADERAARDDAPASAPAPEPDEARAGGEPARGQEAADFVINEESLVIKPWEADFAERLFTLIPTPRSAKRFSNIYRILKATVRGERLAKFEGTAEAPGDFQIPMLLLAILIGSPAEAAALFPKLQRHAAGRQDVLEALGDFKLLSGLDSPPLRALEENIRAVRTEDGLPDNAEVFLEWIPRVSRFSFEIGRAVQPAISPARPADVPRD